MGPWDIIGNTIVGIFAVEKKEKRIQQWCRLLFQMFVSSFVTFLFVTGGALVTSQNYAISVGSGLVSAAVTLVYYVRRSPLTKGMMFIFPAKEAEVELNTNIQVLTREEK